MSEEKTRAIEYAKDKVQEKEEMVEMVIYTSAVKHLLEIIEDQKEEIQHYKTLCSKMSDDISNKNRVLREVKDLFENI